MEERTVEQIQLETIQELKAKMDAMVDPEEHAKLKTQYDTLLKSMINKRTPVEEKPTTRPAKELAKEFIKNEPMSNREYVKQALEYRDAMIKEFGKDPFNDGKTDPAETQRVADALLKMVQESDSDSEFRYLFDQTVKDDADIAQMLKAKKKGGK